MGFTSMREMFSLLDRVHANPCAWGGAKGRWVSDPCALSSLSLSLSLSLSVSPGNHLKVK